MAYNSYQEPCYGVMGSTMFISGNNAPAKKVVHEILDRIGFEVENMGAIEAARAIEPLCILWCIPVLLRNEWPQTIRLIRPDV